MPFSWSGAVNAALSRLSSFYNGNAYNASTNAGGMANDGHRVNFIPSLQDESLVGNAVASEAIPYIETQVGVAVAAATNAINSPGTQATSTTSLAISTGSKTLTLTQTGKSFVVTQFVLIAVTSIGSNYMVGQITAYNSSTGEMTVNVLNTNGTGTFSAWTITQTAAYTSLDNTLLAIASTTPTTDQIIYFNGTDSATVTSLTSFGRSLIDDVNASAARTTLGAAAITTNVFSGAQIGGISTLTDGATITPDFSLNNRFTVTLGGNRTLSNPTNIVAGQGGTIKIVQDATGSRTMAFGSYWKFPGGTVPTLTTTANAVDMLVWEVDSTTTIRAALVKDIK